MAKAKSSPKKRASTTAQTTRRDLDLEVVAIPPKRPMTEMELGELRAVVVRAHRIGTREELDAAVKALVDAGDENPPVEARGTLARWGLL